MNLCASVFVYVGSFVLYKRIVNANTQNIRIANADGQAAANYHENHLRKFYFCQSKQNQHVS